MSYSGPPTTHEQSRNANRHKSGNRNFPHPSLNPPHPSALNKTPKNPKNPKKKEKRVDTKK